MRRRSGYRASCAVLLAVMWSASACASDDAPAGDRTRSDASTSADPLPPPAPQDAEQAYAAALATLGRVDRITNAAYRRGDGRATGLDEVAEGPALVALRKGILSYRKQRYHATGTITAAPTAHRVTTYDTYGTDVAFGQVTVTRCFDYSGWRLLRSDGGAAPRSGPQRSLFVQDVVYDAATMSWKLTRATASGKSCSAARPGETPSEGSS